MFSTTGCRTCSLKPASTVSSRRPASRFMLQEWARHHCRRAAISACTWSAISRGSTASAASSGAVRIPIRCGISFGLRTGTRFRTIPGCRRRAADCRTRWHEQVFGWVLNVVAERGLVKGERIGVDGSTMEANAALRTIVRRDGGETYRAMLMRMAKESGVETPTIDDLVRLDRKRKGKMY